MKYPVDCGTPTVDLTTVKILLNGLVSTPNTKFMTIYVKYFYFNTMMSRSEYMRLKISDLPENMVQQYNNEAKATKDGYMYLEMKRGVYGIPQSGLIAQQLLEKILNKKGYR